jgi:phenylacetate-coenzyme A ligase PaaK-like adenylate-forming protein
MGPLETAKKFFKLSTALEKMALGFYDRLPLALRYRISYGSTFLYWLTFLEESENWDRDRIIVYQFEQLRNVLLHAMRHIPYYKKLFSDYGFNPGNLQSIEDIKFLPYLDKETVRDRIDEFVDESIPTKFLIKEQTSGSTGIPLTIFGTKESQEIFEAFLIYSFNRIGYTPRSREVLFRNMIESGKYSNLPYLRYGNKLLLSTRYVMVDEWLKRYVQMIIEFKPEFITGFPSVLTIIALFIKNRNLSFDKVKAIKFHAETLYDWQKDLIEGIFHKRIFSVYAMTEPLLFGSECEYSMSQHLYPYYGITEFDALGDGREEVVGTGFLNYAMPLIRYKTSDIALRGGDSCPLCGRYHQLIDKIEGRINDYLINREGKIIPRLMAWIKIFPNTKQYQFSQDEPGRAYLKIVRAETYSESDSLYIKSKIAEMLGPLKDSINIELTFVDSIPRKSSGKFIMVDQKLNIRDFAKTG